VSDVSIREGDAGDGPALRRLIAETIGEPDAAVDPVVPGPSGDIVFVAELAGHPAGYAAVRVDGAVLVESGGTAMHGRLYAKGSYPVGSGDSFLAGLLAALDTRKQWEGALRLALGAATANAEQPGAGRLDPRRAADLAARSEISTLSE